MYYSCRRGMSTLSESPPSVFRRIGCSLGFICSHRSFESVVPQWAGFKIPDHGIRLLD